MLQLRHLLVVSVLAGLMGACGGGGGGPGTAGTGSGGSGGAGAGGGAGTSCVVTATDLPVSDGNGDVPAVVWGGDRFAVAWQSLEVDGGDILLATLDATGNRLSLHPIATGPEASSLPSLVKLATGYLVVWQDANGPGSLVRGRYTDEGGNPTGPSFLLGQSSNPQARPSVAAATVGVAAAWADTVATALVGPVSAGALGATAAMSPGGMPDLAGAGAALGLVWNDAAPSNQRLAFSALVSPAGPPAPIYFRGATGQANVPRLANATDGAFWVTWEDNRDGAGNETIFATRIGSDGTVQAETRVPSQSGSANYPDVVWTGSRAAILYYQFVSGPPAVYLSRLDARLARQGEDLQVSGKGAAKHPRAAWSGAELGVVYGDPTSTVKLALVACPP